MHTIDETTIHDTLHLAKDVQVPGFTHAVQVRRDFHGVTEMQARALMITPWNFAEWATVYTGRKTIVGDHVIREPMLKHMDGILHALELTEGVISVEIEPYWEGDWDLTVSI